MKAVLLIDNRIFALGVFVRRAHESMAYLVLNFSNITNSDVRIVTFTGRLLREWASQATASERRPRNSADSKHLRASNSGISIYPPHKFKRYMHTLSVGIISLSSSLYIML